jgi:hypothetical protein
MNREERVERREGGGERKREEEDYIQTKWVHTIHGERIHC